MYNLVPGPDPAPPCTALNLVGVGALARSGLLVPEPEVESVSVNSPRGLSGV